MVHELLKLLLLLFIVPSCWSLCDISAARRDAQTGACRKMNPAARLPKMLSKRASNKAKVKFQTVEEAYYMTNRKPPEICVLFTAWSDDCISQLMGCIASASSFGLHHIEVGCIPIYLVDMSVKSGGRVYLSRDKNAPIVSEASSVQNVNKHLLLVACRLWHNLTDDARESKEKFCLSVIDPSRPAWFVRHYGYYLYLEPEYSPRNAHIFDQDASFFATADKFATGFMSFESVNYPDHYIQATDDGRMKISKFQDSEKFRNSASFYLHGHFLRENYPCSSCKEIFGYSHMHAPSGEYSIRTSSGTILDKVYCEMGLNGGGYTFINPQCLSLLTNDDLQAMFKDKNSFLMRVRKPDSTQPYGVLQQLPQYQNVPLKLCLNEHSGYAAPQNLEPLGPHYLYFGFIPISKATNHNQQGLQVNGYNLTFTNCDKNPNSYKALFPNFAERTPTDYGQAATYELCNDIMSALLLNPSTRVMPADYFMFYETHWGGCGCYTQTDGRDSIGDTLNVAIGFR